MSKHWWPSLGNPPSRALERERDLKILSEEAHRVDAENKARASDGRGPRAHTLYRALLCLSSVEGHWASKPLVQTRVNTTRSKYLKTHQNHLGKKTHGSCYL